MRKFLFALILIPSLAFGQALQTDPKGSTPRGYPTSEAIDANIHALHVKSVGAAASGDGKILDGTAAGEADVMGSNPTGTEQGLVTRNIPSGTQPVSGTVTANQGTPAAVSGAWPAKITDGTDTAQVTATAGGSLQIECAAGCGGAATFVDGGAGFTQESSSVNAPAGFIFDDVAGTALTENDIAAARITAARAQVMRVEGATRGTYASLTGTSVDVNCTGGCGSAAEGQTYTAAVFSSAAAANKDHLNLFNATGSGKIIKILSITVAPQLAAAITGLVQSFLIQTTSSAGATCTAITTRLEDSNNAAVPAQVTSSTNCTTDPTNSFDWTVCSMDGDEARSSISRDGNCYKHHANGGQPKTLREGQGISIRSGALSGAWPVHAFIRFTM